MLPRPESEGLGVPLDVEPNVEFARMGSFESSLLTCSRPRVEEATSDAERVETAVEILVNKIASEAVNDPAFRGCSVLSKSIKEGMSFALLR
jgi:hypothetical protein